MRCKVIIFSLALICLGCIPKTQPNAFDGISALYPNVSRQLAEDAARQLASAFPPGQTEFSVNSETAFGKALEDSLRRKGFMVSSEGPPIQYSVDVLHDTASPSCYVRLSFADA